MVIGIKVEFQLAIWRSYMYKKRLLFALAILVSGLASCCNSENNELAPKINEYLSYEEMINAECEFHERYGDSEKYVFKLNQLDMEDYEVKYFIGGICYCPLENSKKPSHCKSNVNCPNLKNRELFAEYHLKSGNIVTIIYKDFSSNDYDSLNWIESNGGNCYRYEPNVNNELSYILTNSENSHLCGMKFLYKDDTLKGYFCEFIRTSIF